MFQELISWEYLASLPGLIIVTYLIVNFGKDLLDRVPALQVIGTFRIGYFVAVLLQVAIAAIDGLLGGKMFVLILVNGFVIELAAGKINDVTIQKHMERISQKAVTWTEAEKE